MSTTGFLQYQREDNEHQNEIERVKNYNEFKVGLVEPKRKVQAQRCMNCGIPFCGAGVNIKGATIGCPLHNYIPEWNKLIALGLFEEAFKRLMLTTSFPEFTGRVCPALCEVGCTLNIINNPVTIKDNELFLIEEAYKNGWIKPKHIADRKNEKIAVIGSGPAGLALADELNKQGYNATIFERSDRFGGLLMYGIPNMKLDKAIIERRINLMKAEGISFVANFDLAKSKAILSNYDAICLATGCSKPRSLNVAKENLQGVVYAVDYLKANTKALLDSGHSDNIAQNKNVIIVGGGDTGNDCIATALRQKALSVYSLEIMPKKSFERTNSWPEWPNNLKTDYGASEAIIITGNDVRHFGVKIKEIIGLTKVEAVKIVDLKWEVVNGKFASTEISGTERIIPADLIIIASGFIGCEDELVKQFDLPINEKGNIIATNYQIKDNLFCCGDAYTGQSLVVKAISSARDCSHFIIDYLQKTKYKVTK